MIESLPDLDLHDIFLQGDIAFAHLFASENHTRFRWRAIVTLPISSQRLEQLVRDPIVKLNDLVNERGNHNCRFLTHDARLLGLT